MGGSHGQTPPSIDMMCSPTTRRWLRWHRGEAAGHIGGVRVHSAGVTLARERAYLREQRSSRASWGGRDFDGRRSAPPPVPYSSIKWHTTLMGMHALV